jgi:two-component sensor histidine kinase
MKPGSILKLLKWLNPKQPNRAPSYFKMVFIWDPGVTFIFSLAFDGVKDFWSRSLLSLTIAITVTNVIFLLVAILTRVEAGYFKVRKLPAPPPSQIRIWTICILGMIPGMYFGFIFAGVVARHFHFEWNAPGFTAYSSGLVFGMLLFVIFILGDLWHGALNARQAAQLQIKQLENERLQAQLSALTAQMNPHLLFNALNTIASLIPTDPEVAEDVTIKLSELYRGVLDSSRKANHSLAEELKICSAYLAIEQSRFGERLNAQIEIHPSLDPSQFFLPALLLQPLVENAVKHGIAPRSSGGKITLSARLENSKLILAVEDNGVGFGNSTSTTGAGSGIANCRSRVQLKYGDQGNFEIRPRAGGGTTIEITLPLIHTESNHE